MADGRLELAHSIEGSESSREHRGSLEEHRKRMVKMRRDLEEKLKKTTGKRAARQGE